MAAYEHAIELFEESIARNPESRASSDHYIAVALAGLARLSYERGEDERALRQLLASFERKPEAADSLDGLNLSAVATAQMLLARLEARQEEDLAATLRAGLDQLDPAQLELPRLRGRRARRTRALAPPGCTARGGRRSRQARAAEGRRIQNRDRGSGSLALRGP